MTDYVATRWFNYKQIEILLYFKGIERQSLFLVCLMASKSTCEQLGV